MQPVRKSTHKPVRSTPSRRQWRIVLFAAVIVWTVSVTAGSDTPAAALTALRHAVPLSTVRSKPDTSSISDAVVPDVSGTPGKLSLAAAVVLRQSPMLYSVREDVLSHASGTDDTSDNAQSRHDTGTETARTRSPENYDDAQAVPLNEQAADPSGLLHTPDLSPDSVDTPDTPSNNNEPSPTPDTPSDNGEPSTTTDTPSDNGEPSPTTDTPSDNGEPSPTTDTPSDNGEPSPTTEESPVDNGVRAKTLVPTSTGGYTVCGRVYISSSRGDSLSVGALREPFDAELTSDAPQILILHTHGSEAYTPVAGTNVVWSGDCRTTDFRYSVVKSGDEMAAVFADAGISVIHDRTLYDYPNYTGSYDRSLAAIQSYMAQYPSIRFILDVHRDYISDSQGTPYKVVSEIDGVGTAAQMTLVMGSDGSGLYHPDWMENLKLAVAVQEQILTDYPTLMRPILLRRSRYNQHVTTGSLLVEVGTAGNAPEEAFLSARLFAKEMVKVLQSRS